MCLFVIFDTPRQGKINIKHKDLWNYHSYILEKNYMLIIPSILTTDTCTCMYKVVLAQWLRRKLWEGPFSGFFLTFKIWRCQLLTKHINFFYMQGHFLLEGYNGPCSLAFTTPTCIFFKQHVTIFPNPI